jgi:hypothetical protein
VFKLPDDFPLHRFIGREVQDVFEGSHYVAISLKPVDGGNARIEFEGPVDLSAVGQATQRIDNEQLVLGGTQFQSLGGANIQKVIRLSDCSCRFAFSNGWLLDLIGAEGGFESYHLRVDGNRCDV